MANVLCGHSDMQNGRCPRCGASPGSGRHDFCGWPWDDHSGWLIAKVVSPTCPKPVGKR